MADTMQDAISPHIRPADRELDPLREIGVQLAQLVVETARRVGEDPDSLHLRALDHITTAERAFWRAHENLVQQRAVELWHAEQEQAS